MTLMSTMACDTALGVLPTGRTNATCNCIAKLLKAAELREKYGKPGKTDGPKEMRLLT